MHIARGARNRDAGNGATLTEEKQRTGGETEKKKQKKEREEFRLLARPVRTTE